MILICLAICFDYLFYHDSKYRHGFSGFFLKSVSQWLYILVAYLVANNSRFRREADTDRWGKMSKGVDDAEIT